MSDGSPARELELGDFSLRLQGNRSGVAIFDPQPTNQPPRRGNASD